MPISADPNKVIIAGDGQTTDFDFGSIFDLHAGSTGSDIYVFIVDASGNITHLTSNYTVNTATG